jgi:4'-phosphopantetheinyl transferase
MLVMCYEALRVAESPLSLLSYISKYHGLASYLTWPENESAAFTMAIRPLLSMITNATELNHGYPTPAQSPNQGEITCWLLDTREVWPGKRITDNADAVAAMSLISKDEQKSIRGKLFAADAKMSLASALLKRLFISQTLNIKWEEVRLGRKGNEKHGKPCAIDAVGRPISGIDFNVSHQNGLVALIGYNGQSNHEYTPSGMVYGMISPTTKDEVMVGVDIVCVNERDDYKIINEEGVDGWVDIYEYVFSAEERWSMKYDVDYVTLYDGTVLTRDDIGRLDRCITRHKDLSVTTPAGKKHNFSSESIIEAKLRRFYTYFCYKEAYIKLAGEALLAPWLKQLEFFNVRSPKPGVPARCSTHGIWGEQVDDVEVHMHGKQVHDVRMKVQALEEDYMLSTAIQGDIQGIKVPAFQSLNLEKDVMQWTPLAYKPSQLRRFTQTHNRNVSEPIPSTKSKLINTPVVNVKEVPSIYENPYLFAREVPLCLM